MCFKNFSIFKVQGNLDFKEIENIFFQYEFKECFPHEKSSVGWISPFEDNKKLYYLNNKILILKLKIQDKIIPKEVIEDLFKIKLAFLKKNEIELEKNERENIKDKIYNSLLPKAFTRSHFVIAYIDLDLKLLLINTTINNDILILLNYIKKTFKEIVITQVEIKSISDILESWIINNNLPEDFKLLNKCFLKGNNTNISSICFYKTDFLKINDIINFLKYKSKITELGMSWQNRVNFIITDKMQIKSFKILSTTEDNILYINEYKKINSKDQITKFLYFTKVMSDFLKILKYFFYKNN